MLSCCCSFHASTSWHWPSIQVSVAIFMSLQIIMLISYSLWPLQAHLSFFFGSCLWSQQSGTSLVSHDFFFWHCLPRSVFAVSVTTLLNSVTLESISASSFTSIVRGATLPPIVAWEAFISQGSFSFLVSNLIFGYIPRINIYAFRSCVALARQVLFDNEQTIMYGVEF